MGPLTLGQEYVDIPALPDYPDGCTADIVGGLLSLMWS